MPKRKVKIRETFDRSQKRIWIVSCNGQSKVCYSLEEAKAAKAAIEKGESNA